LKEGKLYRPDALPTPEAEGGYLPDGFAPPADDTNGSSPSVLQEGIVPEAPQPQETFDERMIAAVQEPSTRNVANNASSALIDRAAGFEGEDLIIGAFTKSWRHFATDPATSEEVDLGQYLRRAITNLAIDRARYVARRPMTLTLNGELPLEELLVFDPGFADAADEIRQVREAIRQLPSTQRAVTVLRYYYELNEAEIAETLGISKGTVKSASSRARAALRELLAEE
jgi:RNA polymerase sigma factor (sigma-70 family)